MVQEGKVAASARLFSTGLPVAVRPCDCCRSVVALLFCSALARSAIYVLQLADDDGNITESWIEKLQGAGDGDLKSIELLFHRQFLNPIVEESFYDRFLGSNINNYNYTTPI
ncbi:zinc finger protein CONSTANS-LIKE 5 [Striga asiatica]|uniref:Zinc finger protein CONSTANS-LIKE 5 n=1 Tax=Striga asiatica TaxID=4170 RepID=A0A5A7QFX6_STRAF|nr:zinc finger protein CONSTANS-LIKE 5 [Striga asiatica]